MKKINFVNPFFTLGMRSLLFVAGLFIATSTHAGLMNADFSNGVDGLDDWMGDIFTTGGDNFGDITHLYPQLFSTSGGAATIQTGLDGTDDAYIVSLYQDFVLDPISAGASLFLSVDLTAFADDFTAQLLNLDTFDAKILVSGVEKEITSWIGANLSLVFTVEDFDFQLGDSLTISNIQIQERLSVPEPPLFFAMLFVAFFLIRNRRLTR